MSYTPVHHITTDNDLRLWFKPGHDKHARVKYAAIEAEIQQQKVHSDQSKNKRNPKRGFSNSE